MNTADVVDSVSARLRWAILISIVINAVLWSNVSGLALRPPHFHADAVEISRVTMDADGHKLEKVVTKKDVAKMVAQVKKDIEKLKPVQPKPIKPKPSQLPQKPPEGAHNRVITALPNPNGNPKPDDPSALTGGNAAIGKPIEAQNPGNAAANPEVKPEFKPVPKPDPKPEVKPEVKPEIKPEPKPEVKPEPKPEVKPEVKPEPKPETKPKGPTRDAEPDNQVKPEIPEDLKRGQYKSFVRVKVDVAEDGGFEVILRTSSGNAEIDRRVLDSLKRWKWKAALKDGIPVRSTQLFKFEFEVE